jgi:thermitase
MSPRHALLTLGLSAAAWAGVVAPVHAHAGAPEARPAITEVIVRFDPAVVSLAQLNTAAGTTTVAASTSLTGGFLLRLPAGADADLAAATITAMPGVDWAVPNTALTPPEVDADRIYAWRIYAWSDGSPVPTISQYAADAVHLGDATGLASGAGVVVAVLDTGVGPHSALDLATVPGFDLVDGDRVATETLNGLDDDGDGQIDEGAGHGTHVAGVIHQVAPAAAIMPVRVLDDDGSGTMWAATEGMYLAAANGADVINMSLGTHGSAQPLRAAVDAVSAQGVLVVAAAGNDGKDRRSFPAAAPLALAVGSVGPGDVLSSFSNFGKWVDVVAPGEDIHSAYPFPANSYAANSGTSMATPWVAGEAALVLSNRPSLSPAGVSAAIEAGAHSIDAANPAHLGLTGAGRIDIAATLRAI